MTTTYTDITGSIPKVPSLSCAKLIGKQLVVSNAALLSNSFLTKSSHLLYYFRAVQYWFKILIEEPIYDKDGVHKVTSEMKPIYMASVEERDAMVSILSSSTFFSPTLLGQVVRLVNSRNFNLYCDFTNMQSDIRNKLAILGAKLQNDYQRNSHIKERNYSKKGRNFVMKKQHFFIKFSKPIIDEIDGVLARHYGFTDEELDFIINYDIKYRMGDELNEE